MNLLVGPTGFIGGHVVEYLFQQSEISKGMFRKGSHLKIMDSNGVLGIEADLFDHHSLHEAVEGTDTIYSMASPMPLEDNDFERINTEGILNLLEVAQELKVKAIVHLSTLDVYGFGTKEITGTSQPSPSSPYQKSKLEADRLLLEFAKRNQDPRIVIIRPARAVGSRDSSLVVPLLQMLESKKAIVPDSKKMSFSHPRDIASAMYKAATNASLRDKTYLLKSFDASAEELARGLVEATGSAANVGKEGMFSKSSLPPYTAEQLKAGLHIEQQGTWAELGYAPEFGLKQTCEEIGRWYKKNPWATQTT